MNCRGKRNGTELVDESPQIEWLRTGRQAKIYIGYMNEREWAGDAVAVDECESVSAGNDDGFGKEWIEVT